MEIFSYSCDGIRPEFFDANNASRVATTVLLVNSDWPTDPGASPPWAPPGSSATDERISAGGVGSSGGQLKPQKIQRKHLFGAVVIIVCVAVLAGVVMTIAADKSEPDNKTASGTTAVQDRDHVVSPPSEPPDEIEQSGRRGAGGTGDRDIDIALEEISRFVEVERGLEFKGPVDVELVSDGVFRERLLEDFEEDSEELERTAGQLRALGLIEPRVDLSAELRNLLGVGVLGFYDPETKELVVRGTDLTPYTRQTVAHELTHALDDQWFDLDRPELDDANDESGFGFSALVEGNARRVENAYTESLTALERRELQREEQTFVEGADLSTVPAALIHLIMAPYDLGHSFVNELLRSGGAPVLDASFSNPPTTSEQVIDPERFLAGEEALPVTVPPADGEVVEQGTLGQLVLEMMLTTAVGSASARVAADGWGGDQYVTWLTTDGRTCIRDDLVMDTGIDLIELADALEQWASVMRGVQIDRFTDRVRLTACA